MIKLIKFLILLLIFGERLDIVERNRLSVVEYFLDIKELLETKTTPNYSQAK